MNHPQPSNTANPKPWARGFLPAKDPATHFPPNSRYRLLDEIGWDLPSLLVESDFRDRLQRIDVPQWQENGELADSLAYQRLYYLRIGFIASAYVNQVGQTPATLLPANLAKPLCRICRILQRPPILSYDGYALYNWKRFDPAGPIALGNIDTIQNFVHLYDEHWFILIHVDIENKAARQIQSIIKIQQQPDTAEVIHSALSDILTALQQQVQVLRRIPEHMDPALYFHTFRPYIRFFENVNYEGETQLPVNQRGETGAQSSIMPALVSLMKIPHQPSELTNHLADMRNYMPREHREFLTQVEKLPAIKEKADPELFDAILETMAEFREVHYGWALTYIDQRVSDPRGTGGTPFMQWLKQLIDETRAHKNRH